MALTFTHNDAAQLDTVKAKVDELEAQLRDAKNALQEAANASTEQDPPALLIADDAKVSVRTRR